MFHFIKEILVGAIFLLSMTACWDGESNNNNI
jgi:hypothetical protein